MDRRKTKCLFELEERERTTPRMVQRIGEIRKQLNRATGAIAKVTPERMKDNTLYWHSTIQGWNDLIKRLSAELTLIETTLSASLTE